MHDKETNSSSTDNPTSPANIAVKRGEQPPSNCPAQNHEASSAADPTNLKIRKCRLSTSLVQRFREKLKSDGMVRVETTLERETVRKLRALTKEDRTTLPAYIRTQLEEHVRLYFYEEGMKK